MEKYLKDFEVESENPLEEAIRRWRIAVALIISPRRRFRFVAYLAKRSEAEKKKLQIQGSDDYNPSESLLPSDSPHACTDYDERGNVATGSDDSSRSELLGNVARVVGSDDSNRNKLHFRNVGTQANTDFGEPGTVGPSSPSVVFNIGDENNDFDHPPHGRRVTKLQWIFMLSALSLEALSACFDQLSSPNKSHYALVSLLLAIAAVLTCILELIHNGIKEGVESTNGMVGILPDIFGLGLSVLQCLSSAEQYYFLHQHKNNPVKLSLVPLYFSFCLMVLKVKMN